MPEKKQAVAHEMADVLLYLVQLSTVLGIDLMDAAQAKLLLNAQKYPVDLARGHSRKYDAL
jgi:dCTP diphosphatase